MQSLSNVIKTQHKAKYSYNEWEDSKHNKRTDKKNMIAVSGKLNETGVK